MSTDANFAQLLDAVKDKFSLTDKDLARELECEPTYLSRLRNGKANAGPWITRALKRLNERGIENSKPDEAANNSAIRHLAGLAGVAEMELMARLLSKHGLEVALELKKEREAAANTPPAVPPSNVPGVADELLNLSVEKAKGKK